MTLVNAHERPGRCWKHGHQWEGSGDSRRPGEVWLQECKRSDSTIGGKESEQLRQRPSDTYEAQKKILEKTKV